MVPIINENDTTATDEITFGDNDILAAQVAILMSADLLVVLSDVDGLFTSDPAQRAGAQLVAEVRDLGELQDYEIGMSSSHVGSGGMRSKVLCAEMATAAGIPVVICNGTEPGTLLRAVAGEPVGTRFHPQARRQSSFKLWLRYAKSSSGVVRVDSGAERALREQGTSLLPGGRRRRRGEVRGRRRRGRGVRRRRRRRIGKGISNLSAEELRRVKGMKSAEVREVLPRASEEAVHRDYFVLA